MNIICAFTYVLVEVDLTSIHSVEHHKTENESVFGNRSIILVWY